MARMVRPGMAVLAVLMLQLLHTGTAKDWADPLSLMRRGPPVLTSSSENSRSITEHYITQKLDHNNILDDRTWEQRYFINDDYYVEGGPVFLFISGEWVASGAFTNLLSFMGRLAYDAGAMAIELEHRYYGFSRPTPDMTTENLRFLTVDQALADTAYFAETLKAELGLTNHWIVFGVSYSATLAAWARAAYPHVFHAAYASSGPILAKVDFYEYHDVTGIAMAEYDPECPNFVSSGMAELQQLIAEGGASLDYVSELFYICEPGLNGSSSLDVMTLNSMIANFFGGLVQYAGVDGQKYTCDYIMGGPGTTLENMAYLVKEAYQGFCLTTDYNIVMDYYSSITAWEPINIVRQFIYQECTELGWFWPVSSPDNPFGQLMPVEYFTDWCAEIYGPEFTRDVVIAGVKRTNIVHGGLTPDVTRVLYMHGTLDQWSVLGVNEDLGPDTPVIMIEGGSHSWDMSANATSDPPQLTAAREQASDIIMGWLELP